MEESSPQIDCTLEMVFAAAHLSYITEKIRSDESKHTALLEKSGYREKQRRVQSDEPASYCAAVCYVPEQGKEGPVIIAYRGTDVSSIKDFMADVTLAATGLAPAAYLKEAFEFFETIKKEYPHREIILTGHSLGGHLAQYVAAEAYLTDPEKNKNLLHVRTVNSATIYSPEHEAFIENHPHLTDFFHNYRLENDIVSASGHSYLRKIIKWGSRISSLYGKSAESKKTQEITPQKLGVFGKMFTLRSPIIGNHSLLSFFDRCPPELLQIKVGHSKGRTSEMNAFQETLVSCLYAYQVRINKQVFSGLRNGAQNFKVFLESKDRIIQHLSATPPAYQSIIDTLNTLQSSVKGRQSRKIVQILIHKIETIRDQANQNIQQSTESRSPSVMRNSPSLFSCQNNHNTEDAIHRHSHRSAAQ